MAPKGRSRSRSRRAEEAWFVTVVQVLVSVETETETLREEVRDDSDGHGSYGGVDENGDVAAARIECLRENGMVVFEQRQDASEPQSGKGRRSISYVGLLRDGQHREESNSLVIAKGCMAIRPSLPSSTRTYAFTHRATHLLHRSGRTLIDPDGVVSRPTGISLVGWKTASLVSQTQQHISSRHPSPTIINDTSSLHHPSITTRLPAPTPSLARLLLLYLLPHLPGAHLNLTHPLTSLLHHPFPLLTLLHPFHTSPSSSSSSTYRTALTNLLLAALLTHIHRTLLPRSAAAFLLPPGGHAPLEHIRLARTNPDVFISEALRRAGAGGRYALGAVLKREAGRRFWEGAVGGWLAGELGRVKVISELQSSEDRRVRVHREVWKRVVTVVWLGWVLVEVEYVFALGMDVAAWVVACYKLLLGSEGEEAKDAGRRVFWVAVTAAGWFRALLAVWTVADAVGGRLWPLVMVSLRRTRQGWPGLMVVILWVVGVVWMVLRYRSTFFIALEVSGMFVFLASPRVEREHRGYFKGRKGKGFRG
ncbi:hypothetical protein VTJ49DRAFT_5325 [Mycothermus thermophilus]|uniref:Uncharacterized protein n=1 Tax=Humicola insolens TaxID=85995 RepID=A0ABR3V3K2_HUMIN